VIWAKYQGFQKLLRMKKPVGALPPHHKHYNNKQYFNIIILSYSIDKYKIYCILFVYIPMRKDTVEENLIIFTVLRVDGNHKNKKKNPGHCKINTFIAPEIF